MTIVRQFVPDCGAERALDLDRLKAAMAQPIAPIFAASIPLEMEAVRAAIRGIWLRATSPEGEEGIEAFSD